VVLTDGLALIAGVKHPHAAKEFYEFITTPESFVIQANQFHRIPTRMDVPKENLPRWMRDLSMEVMEVDWQLLAEQGGMWMAYWDTHIKGKGHRGRTK
jgi:iron(III) transport system substrate-binding protein